MRDWQDFIQPEDVASELEHLSELPVAQRIVSKVNRILREELAKAPVAYEFIGTYRLWRKRSYARKKDLRSAKLIDIQNLKPPKEP